MSDTIRCRECGVPVKAGNEASHMSKVHPHAVFERGRESQSRPIRPKLYVTSRAKRVVFAIVVAAVMIPAAVLLLQAAEKGTPVNPNATSVHVSMSGFDPDSLTVKAGQTLTIDLINMDNQYHMDGGGWHNFAIDAFGMNVSVEPLGQHVFTIPTGTPGTYDWYCSVCCGGRASPSMNGKLVIQA